MELTILSAWQGKTLSHKIIDKELGKTPKKYFELELNDEELKRAQHNIEELKKCLQ